jgi:hypothetical protein
MSVLIPSPALNPEADNRQNALRFELDRANERVQRLSLSNRMLRDHIRDLEELLRSFGVNPPG